MEVNTVCGILYEVKAKAIIEALVKRQAKVENKTLGERLAEVQAKATLADRLVAVEVDTLRDKLSMVRTEVLGDKLAYGKKEVNGQTLCYRLSEMDGETLIYALADRLPVVEDEKVDNTSAKVEYKAVLGTLAAGETDVKVHTLGNTVYELKGIETLDTLSDTVAENAVESLGDKQVEVNVKALDY